LPSARRGADDGLAALEITPWLHLDDGARGLPWTACCCSRAGSVGGRAVPLTRNVSSRPGTRQQADAVGDQVLEAVEAVVARPVRQMQALLVHDGHEARRIAARRGVGPAVGVRRRYHHKGRAADEVAGRAQ
jgi:hypothetical protein